MSYINKALQKAQKDKKLTYTAYEPVSSSSIYDGKKRKKFHRWVILILGVWITGGLAFWLWPNEKKAASLIPKEPRSVGVAKAQGTHLTEALPANRQNVTEAVAGPPVKTEPEKAKEDTKNLYAEALRHQREGHLQKAKELYKKVIKLDPQNIEALNNLGVVYMDSKAYKWATIRLKDALRIKPDYADAHYNLACLYARQNDTAQSIRYLKKAVGYNPDVRRWAKNDKDLQILADLPEFKKLVEKN